MAQGAESREPRIASNLLSDLKRRARPLANTRDLSPLLSRLKSARVVLLGEASHGTHEYYVWRTAITQKLFEEGGFSFIAVEGDWPDCHQINRFVKGRHESAGDAYDALEAFGRWPTWMWANAEVRDLGNWLRNLNDQQPREHQVGFYGLDVYSLWASLYEVGRYVQKHQPGASPAVRDAFRCFEPFGEDAQHYAHHTSLVPDNCRDAVVSLLKQIRQSAEVTGDEEREKRFLAEQNALVIQNAEAYYRAMVRSDRQSWNLRDSHMAETLQRLLDHHSPDSKAIVWAHNTHVGDARHTDMCADGLWNLGQLVREKYGEDHVAIVGFGSWRGSVIAAESWGAPWQQMVVPPAQEDSWEAILHAVSPEDKLLLFGNEPGELLEPRGHRAIGVVYRPQRDFGHYVPTVLPKRYDAFVYIDESRAIHPLIPAEDEVLDELPETYPTGV